MKSHQPFYDSSPDAKVIISSEFTKHRTIFLITFLLQSFVILV